MAKQLGELVKKAGDYAGTAANTGIALATAGIEQLTTLAVYRCPCVTSKELGCNITQIGSPKCVHFLNLGYGLSFIIAPAIALFVFGMISNPKMWKLLTGCNHKQRRKKPTWTYFLWTLTEVSAAAMIAPVTWVAIALLDGRFYACAVTAFPYDVEHALATYPTCEAVAAAKTFYTSDSFNDNRSFSQFLGWVVISGCLIVGLFLFGYTQCSSPLTYYHAKYYRLYKGSEEAEFDDEMSKKAQIDAESNVRKFMEERREKKEWDRISTVYEFHRDRNNLALYSNLHSWVLEEDAKSKKALLGDTAEEPGEEPNGNGGTTMSTTPL
uniref:Protein FAM26F-like n=1 Tax=Phallusia mammillata TaxID=59560 RepID=A0A6F9DD78_9ASCI|nr:protein FAM26F-like [Phallusia mammillata]